MKLRTPLIAVVVIVVFFAGIGGSIAFNLWKTAGSGEAAQSASSKAVKGSTTVNDLISWGLTMDEIASVIGKPVSNTTATVKSIADTAGIEFSLWKTPLQAIVDSKK